MVAGVEEHYLPVRPEFSAVMEPVGELLPLPKFTSFSLR